MPVEAFAAQYPKYFDIADWAFDQRIVQMQPGKQGDGWLAPKSDRKTVGIRLL
jgi:hypothetical protein